MEAEDPGLAAQVRWYEGMRAACARQPELHRAQAAALAAHVALVGRAPSLAAFAAALAHGGHATALARAAQEDRFAADAALAAALGDGLAGAAAAAALDALAAAPGDAGFTGALAAVGVAAAAAADAEVAAEHAARLVEAAIDAACDPDPRRRADAAAAARASWLLARTAAPGFGVGWLRAAPLRHRVPFGDHAWPPLRELIAAALAATGPEPRDDDLDGAPPPAPPPPPRPPVPCPVAALPLAGWPPAPDDDPAGIAARAAALAAGVALAAARAPLVAALEAARDLAARRAEPALVRRADEALAGLAAAATPTALAAWVRWHAAVTAIERSWWHLLVHAALWPAAAAMIAPDPAAARPAAVVAARLLGADPLAALAAPAVAAAARRQLVEAGQTFDEDRPVIGPGQALVAPVRRAAAEHAAAAIEAAAARGAPLPELAAAARRWPDLAALVAHVAGVLAATNAPRGGDAPLVLWGARVPLAAADGLVAAVARPRPPGLGSV